MERSLIILKPDCMQRKLVGQVISRFENIGLNISACKIMTLDKELLKEHYAHLVHLPFYHEIEEFMMTCPVMVLVLEGRHQLGLFVGILAVTRCEI